MSLDARKLICLRLLKPLFWQNLSVSVLKGDGWFVCFDALCPSPHFSFMSELYLGRDARKSVFGGLQTTKRRPACASAQSDQRLCYSFFEKYHT